jgi:hypothetical protein
MDAPGNAETGVEGANRMFATGTPNPPCSKEKSERFFLRNKNRKTLFFYSCSGLLYKA